MAEPTSTLQQAFVADYKRRKRHIIFWQIFICVVFVALWEGTTYLGILNDFIFSSPSRIVKTFILMAADGTVFYHIGITLFETFLSFFIVLAAGILLSVLLWWNRSISSVLEPYLITLNSLPKTALAPIFIVWLGNNMKTIIVCAVSLAIFGTVINLTTSFTQMDPDKLLLIKNPRRRPEGYASESHHPRKHPGYHKQHESKHRPLPGWRYHRRISLRKCRTWISDCLWQPGFQAGLGTHVHCTFMYHRHRPLRAAEFNSEILSKASY